MNPKSIGDAMKNREILVAHALQLQKGDITLVAHELQVEKRINFGCACMRATEKWKNPSYA
jgi:hypothetical protein